MQPVTLPLQMMLFVQRHPADNYLYQYTTKVHETQEYKLKGSSILSLVFFQSNDRDL